MMHEDASPDRPLRRLASTGWLDPADTGPARVRAEVRRFTRHTWRLPSNVPASSAHHALSSRFPVRAGLSRLMRALTGRFVVVNYAPAAAPSRPEAALVRGLARAALWGLPTTPWPTALRRASARWPADSRQAYEDTLAAGWVARHPGAAAWVGRARRVAVALYEADPRLRVGTSNDASPLSAAFAAFSARAEYRLALLVDVRPAARHQSSPAPVPASDFLTAGRAHEVDPPRPWFGGRVLLPDAVATEAMDEASRVHWARLTGRLETADRYWCPESWARFLEPGRRVGCVSAAGVGRSVPGALPGATVSGGRHAAKTYGPRLERGLAVPPGYCLVDCMGSLALAVVPT